MFLGIFSGFFIVIAVLAILLGGRLLFGVNWILGWIRGCVGFALLALSVFVVFAVMDLFSYQEVLKNRPIATVSLDQLGPQHFEVKLSLIDDGKEKTFQIYGDQWQIDARLIRWKGFFLAMGAKPGYRLDRIAGRYYSLEEERRKERSVFQLNESQFVDTWYWFKNYDRYIPLVDATYGSATYLPMVDGALYELGLSSSGLVATPVNSVAQDAIHAWQ